MNDSFVKMATEMANLALNFEQKVFFCWFQRNHYADKLIEQTGVIGEKTNHFRKLEGAFIGYIHSGNKINY
jgi:elongation factor Ts